MFETKGWSVLTMWPNRVPSSLRDMGLGLGLGFWVCLVKKIWSENNFEIDRIQCIIVHPFPSHLFLYILPRDLAQLVKLYAWMIVILLVPCLIPTNKKSLLYFSSIKHLLFSLYFLSIFSCLFYFYSPYFSHIYKIGHKFWFNI